MIALIVIGRHDHFTPYWPKHGYLERTTLSSGVCDGLVHVGEVKVPDVPVFQVQQTGAYQVDQADVGLTRTQPLTDDGDAIAHDPRIGQREIVATQHPHAAHQDDSAVFPHCHRSCAHRFATGGGRQKVQDAVDWAGSGVLHPLSIFHLVAGESQRPHPRAKAALQVFEHHLVSARTDDATRA